MNGDLRGLPRIRVVGPSGEPLGVMTLAEGLRAAMKWGLDLVEINPKADPPVCRILDFGRDNYTSARAGAQKPRRRDPGARGR